MTRDSWIIFCLAYIVGLLSIAIVTGFDLGYKQQLGIAIAIVTGLTLFSALALRFRIDLSYRGWLGAGTIAIVAIIYFQLRIPQPNSNDISYLIKASNGEVITVVGKVITEPRLNANQKIKFLLQAQEIDRQKQVSGKLYATVPILQGTGVHSGSQIELKGILYLPQPAQTPNGFDFQQYLARQGIFAGIRGLEIVFDDYSEPKWGWWKLRQRIVRSQLQGLESPVGQLVSSMVLGRKAVDLPEEIRARFIEAGLAHILAASGFHVSLLLGIVLKLTQRFAAKPRLILGMLVLLVYLGLTGIGASVLRACLMGSAVLIAITANTKVKPLGSLLLAATIILLFNPLAIEDLGFQLSFLATFGLIVTMPGILARLDWLPPTIATTVAIPLAASVWVLPLLSYVFNSVATYSIIVNIICTPLILIVSLGGMISGIFALIWPTMGSAIAFLLLYPARILIAIVNFFTNLPGSSWAVGQISWGILSIIYGLFFLVWLHQWWRKRIWLVFLFVLTIVVTPVGYRHFTLTQITVLPTQPEPMVVIQNRGQIVLINSAKSQDVKYIVLPFLAQQGINNLDYFVNFHPSGTSNWFESSDRLSINKIVSHNSQYILTNNSFKMSVDFQLSLSTIETPTEIWLILSNSKPDKRQIQRYIRQNKSFSKPIIAIGSTISSEWLQLSPQNIITTNSPSVVTPQNIQNSNYYNLKQGGAVSWTPQKGLSQTKKISEHNIF